ncbi:MAG: hypothetical protein KatS3mg111_1100 [Pirellulaceae bacterium]|nr:MAG: hypothetical protein KatS3mg111_1100 [Pirellulaceae bacterium]
MEPLYLAIVLYVVAVILVLVDIFVPSGGLLVVLGSASAVASILFAFRSSLLAGQILLFALFVSVPLLILLAMKLWPRTPIGRRVILRPPPSTATPATKDRSWNTLLGTVVVAEFPLLPSGELRIGGRRFPAIAQTGIVEAGQRVEVVAVRDFVLVVAPTNKPCTEPSEAGQSAAMVHQQGIGMESDDEVERILETPIEEIGLDDIEEDPSR